MNIQPKKYFNKLLEWICLTVQSSRVKMGRALLALMLALVAVVSCSGCSYKVPGVKNYPLIDIYACQNTIKKHSYRK